MPELADLPSAADVAGQLRARTKGKYMQGEGAFTADTRPTLLEVEALILQAQYDVVPICGWTPAETIAPLARFAVLLRAAMMVELSYFPEQITPDQSPYDRLERAFNDALTRLRAAVDDAASGGEVGGTDRAQARGRFPRARMRDATRW